MLMHLSKVASGRRIFVSIIARSSSVIIFVSIGVVIVVELDSSALAKWARPRSDEDRDNDRDDDGSPTRIGTTSVLPLRLT